MTKRILIADDEPTVVALAKQKLEEHGYRVETARNGREAWGIIKSIKIDLIVLDVIMPIMDGVDVYKELKKDAKTAGIPIIIITDSRIFRESFQTLGIEHFLPKPLDGEKLVHKVDYVFTCEEVERKNKQVLLLGSNEENNQDMVRALQEHALVVGKTTDPIEFFSNCLILNPRVVLIDAMIAGDIAAPEMIRALRCFSRLSETKILVFTQFSPEDIGSMDGIEQLRAAKNRCQEAGADKYIGRFLPATIWDMVSEFVA
ncbi:MAG: response regulator [Candidatus Omnitrophica bacterium]|nr:response regulator [Candidatus Omnitrophota bacterium]